MEGYSSEDVREFVDEVSEHLLNMEQDLLLLEEDPSSTELLDKCFRHMHSIKGACGYMGFSSAASLAHGLENIFDGLRSGDVTPAPRIFDAVFRGVDLLKAFLSSLNQGGAGDLVHVGEMESFVDTLKTLRAEAPLVEDPIRQSEASEAKVDAAGHDEGGGEGVDELDQELMEVFKEEISGLLKRLEDALGQSPPNIDTIGVILDEMERVTNYVGYERALEAVHGLKELLNRVVKSGGKPGPPEFMPLVHDLVNSLPFTYELSQDRGEGAGDGKAMTDLDEDDELYGIFIDFVREKAEPLRELPKHLDEEWILKCQGAIEAIKASASYMDYREVVRILEEWEERLTEVLTECVGHEDAYSKAPLRNLWSQLVRLLPELEEDQPETSGAGLDVDEFSGPVASEDEGGPNGDAFPQGPKEQDDTLDEIGVLIDAFKRDGITAGKVGGTGSGVQEIEGSIRIPAQRVDELVVDVGELAVIRTGVLRLFDEFRLLYARWLERRVLPPRQLKGLKDLVMRFGEHATRLERVSRGLQDHVLDLRMVPVSQLFQRLTRQVRDLSRRLGKEVDLEFRGQDTTLDKQIMEAVQDPLMHIIRNAMDHGIEPPEERVAAKKPARGRLTIEAYHEGNYVVIKVTDDGRGIDTGVVIKRAMEKGLIRDEDLKGSRKDRAIELIFLPGMTTATQLSETSGRGVGLDVVKKNIESLGGMLAVGSKVGEGTSFSMKIPLTLAIIPVLLMDMGGQKIGIPMHAVEETLRVYRDQVSMVEGQEIITVRQKPVPLLRLERVFKGMSPGIQKERLLLVLVKHGDIEAAINADAFLGQHDVVIKPLQEYLVEGPGFSGVATLGDGSVALVLDVAAVMNRAGLWFKTMVEG